MGEGLGYNGWLSRVRHGRDKHYYHARDHGILPKASSCCVCGCGFGDKPVPYHNEEYGPTLEDMWQSSIPICHRCHAMVHARFLTPHWWSLFLMQVDEGKIDESLFPGGSHIAALLSKFKKRKDLESIEPYTTKHPFLKSLPKTEYSGPAKAATLFVIDQNTGSVVEVPDWTLYGENLELLTAEERNHLVSRNIPIDDFLANRIEIKRSTNGQRKYDRLYMNLL